MDSRRSAVRDVLTFKKGDAILLNDGTRLPPDVVEAARAFETALMAAVQRGDVVEDDAQGHALRDLPGHGTLATGSVLSMLQSSDVTP